MVSQVEVSLIMKQTLASKQICEISNSKSAKPPPEVSLGIIQIERFQKKIDIIM